MSETVASTMFIHVSDCSKTQKKCKAVEKDSKILNFSPKNFTTL